MIINDFTKIILKIKRLFSFLINSKHKKQNFISLVILVGGTLLAVLFWGVGFSDNFAQDQKIEQEDQTIEIPVSVVKISSKEANFALLEKTVVFSSQNSSGARADFSGRIEKIYFKVGDNVVQNQVLAVLGGTEDINGLKKSLEIAQEGFQIAQKNVEQTEKLAKESLEIAKNTRKLAEIQLEAAKKNGDKKAIEIAKRNLENAKDIEDQTEKSAQLQINSAKVQAYQAENAFIQVQTSYNKLTIRAPFAGTIISQNFKEGDYISVGSLLAEIVGRQKMEAKIYFSPEQLEGIVRDQEVKIYSKEGKEFSGKIVAFSKVALEQSGRIEARIETSDLPLELANQNLKVKIKLTLFSSNDHFFVPLEALSVGQQKNEVFVLEGKIAYRREVKIGRLIGDRIEITEGIKEGEEVVVKNSQALSEGSKVRIED